MENEFMKVIVKRLSLFFQGLTEHCDDYLDKLEKNIDPNQMSGGKGSKKLKTGNGSGLMLPGQGQKRKPAKKVTDPNMPKRPLTGF